MSEAIIWHDLECGSYDADLPLWLDLAERFGGPVLDVGAGTGRVALRLARASCAVTAIEVDPALAAELEGRAARDGYRIEVACADARSWRPVHRFSLLVVAMQTIQLFGGAAGRREFLQAAREALAPGGVAAIALADIVPESSGEAVSFPPDSVERSGTAYSSRAICVESEPDAVTIERERSVTAPDGTRVVSRHRQRIDRLDADELEAEAVQAGLARAGRERVGGTDRYLGSEVVLLGA